MLNTKLQSQREGAWSKQSPVYSFRMNQDVLTQEGRLRKFIYLLYEFLSLCLSSTLIMDWLEKLEYIGECNKASAWLSKFH